VPPAIGSTGTMGRNLFRGNGLHTWDGSVIKDWKFKERVTGEFRAEVFNLLNQTQYGNPQFNGAGAMSHLERLRVLAHRKQRRMYRTITRRLEAAAHENFNSDSRLFSSWRQYV